MAQASRESTCACYLRFQPSKIPFRYQTMNSDSSGSSEAANSLAGSGSGQSDSLGDPEPSGSSNRSFHFCHSEIVAAPRRRDPSWACRPLLVARTRVRVDCVWPCGRSVTQRGRRWLPAHGPRGPRSRQAALPALRHASQNVKEFIGPPKGPPRSSPGECRMGSGCVACGNGRLP